MNQKIADWFLSLPPALTAPAVSGALALAWCWVAYWLAARVPLIRRVREQCSPAVCRKQLSHWYHRVLYRPVRRKAGLDEGGLYLAQNVLLWGLVAVTLLHPLLSLLPGWGMPAAEVADRVLVTVAVAGVGIASLLAQPRATCERHARWGFRPFHGLVFAVLWEILMMFVILSWIYIAWFLPAVAV